MAFKSLKCLLKQINNFSNTTILKLYDIEKMLKEEELIYIKHKNKFFVYYNNCYFRFIIKDFILVDRFNDCGRLGIKKYLFDELKLKVLEHERF